MTRDAGIEPDLQAGLPDTFPQVAVVVYPGVSELELGLMLGLLAPLGQPGSVGTPDAAALTVARSRGSVMCLGGLVCTPQLIFAAAPRLAGVLLPGGQGAQKAGKDPGLRAFLSAAQAAGLPVGVSGSGLMLAGEAGLLADRTLGCPAVLVDTVWGYMPADIQQDETVADDSGPSPFCSGPGGLNAARIALALASRLWGEQAAAGAAARIGLGAPALTG